MLSSVTPAAACYELLRLRRCTYTRVPHEQTVPDTQAIVPIRESIALRNGQSTITPECRVEKRMKSTGAYSIKAPSWTLLHRYGYVVRELESFASP
jgi:hypothetical protein